MAIGKNNICFRKQQAGLSLHAGQFSILWSVSDLILSEKNTRITDRIYFLFGISLLNKMIGFAPIQSFFYSILDWQYLVTLMLAVCAEYCNK